MPVPAVGLPAHFGIEPELRDQLGRHHGIQRCLEGRDELLLIVHEVPRLSAAVTPLYFWRSHQGRWAQPSGKGLGELPALLEDYAKTVEFRQAGLHPDKTAAELLTTARHAALLARSLRELRGVLDQAHSFEPEDVAIRDCADRCREIERAAEWLRSDTKLTAEFLTGERSAQSNASITRLETAVKRLAVIVTLFVPLIAIGVLVAWNDTIPWLVKLTGWLVVAGVVATAAALLGIRIPAARGSALTTKESNSEAE